MDRFKSLPWLLLIILMTLPGCELTRSAPADVALYDAATTPGAESGVTPLEPATPTQLPADADADADAAATATAPPADTPQRAAASPTAMLQPTQPAQQESQQPAAPTPTPAQPAADEPQPGQTDSGAQIQLPTDQPAATAAPQQQPSPTASPVNETMPTATPSPIEPAIVPTNTPTPQPEIAQPVHIPVDATFGFCYRTQPGETVEVLAQKYGTTAYAINRANDLAPSYYVKPQQTIFVPILPGNGPNVYPVELGDTLAVIAERCKIPERMLARVNNLEVGAPLFEPAGAVVTPVNGPPMTLLADTVVVKHLIIPIPPYPPPSRYQYPTGPIPIVPYSEPYPIQKPR